MRVDSSTGVCYDVMAEAMFFTVSFPPSEGISPAYRGRTTGVVYEGGKLWQVDDIHTEINGKDAHYAWENLRARGLLPARMKKK